MINYWLAIPATLSAVAWTTVVIWYWIRAKWWKTPVGKNAMTLYILLALNFIRLAVFSWLVPFGHLRLDQVATGFITYTISAYVGFRALHLIEDAQHAPVLQCGTTVAQGTRKTDSMVVTRQEGDSMTDILTPAARKIAYRIYAAVALVLGAIQVGIGATPGADQPVWLNVAFAVLAFLGAGFGLVAQANVADPGE